MPDDSKQTRILSPDETQIRTIAPGAVLRGRYRLDNEIGRGGMGVVYSATDLELMRKIAVKVVSDASFVMELASGPSLAKARPVELERIVEHRLPPTTSAGSRLRKPPANRFEISRKQSVICLRPHSSRRQRRGKLS